MKDEAGFYEHLFQQNKGVFFRGEAKGGRGIGMGALGKGVYVSWLEGMARAFAEVHGGTGRVLRCKVKPGLKMLDSKSSSMAEIKKMMGFRPWEYSDSPMYASVVTAEAKMRGFDGVASDKEAEGIVVFDPKNVSCPRPRVKKS